MEGLEIMDALLVPTSLLLLIAYHLQLAYRIHNFPTSTVIGINQINRQVWVQTMMKDGMKNGVLAIQTLRNNIMGSTVLATAAVMLCSVIALLVHNSKDSSNFQQMSILLGDRRVTTSSIKLLCVLICFLVAFLCSVQSMRYYNHVGFLISIPYTEGTITLEYVKQGIMRGGQFWSIGLRAFYFSFPLFFWLFGPIPMFLCSTLLTIVLHYLDTFDEHKQTLVVNPV